MKKILFIFFLTLVSNMIYGQAYRTAAGLRLGGGFGLSVQQLLDKKLTLEGQMRYKESSELTELALLLEQHHSLIFRRFNFYSGLGFYKGWYGDAEGEDRADPFGVSAIVGLEFTLGRLNLSLDFRPNVKLAGSGSVVQAHTALSLRHVFLKKKRKKLKLNLRFWEKW
jgi:hypothetical protein